MDETVPILEKELQRLRDGAYEVWRTYTSWYTWFFGANLIVLGWVLTSKAGMMDPTNIRLLAGMWIAFDLSAFISTLRLREFCVKSTRQADTICHALNERLAPLKLGVEVSSGFAGRLSSWGAAANALSLLAIGIIWAVVFYRFRAA
jgi:hypothetical protein